MDLTILDITLIGLMLFNSYRIGKLERMLNDNEE